MSASVAAVRIHEPEAVREICREAYEIATAACDDPKEWGHVFDAAATLLGARAVIPAQTVAVPADLSKLRV